MQIRETLQRRIVETLDDSRFSAADFTVEFPNAGEVLIRITFKSHRTFKLTLTEEYGGKFKLQECPSDFYFSAVRSDYNKDGLVDAVRKWTERIYEELRAMTPVYDDFEELRQELEKKLDEHVNDANSHFTPDEAEQIRKKIGEFDKFLEKYAETHAELQKQVASLRQDLAKATETIESFSKSTWYRTTFNKVAKGLKALGRSPEVRQLAADSVKRLVFHSLTGVDGEG